MFSSSTCFFTFKPLFHLDFILLSEVKNKSNFIFFLNGYLVVPLLHIMRLVFSPGFEMPPFSHIKFPDGNCLPSQCVF